MRVSRCSGLSTSSTAATVATAVFGWATLTASGKLFRTQIADSANDAGVAVLSVAIVSAIRSQDNRGLDIGKPDFRDNGERQRKEKGEIKSSRPHGARIEQITYHPLRGDDK